MRIAIATLDSRTNVRTVLKSIAAKHELTSEPVFAEKNGQRYLLIGVTHG